MPLMHTAIQIESVREILTCHFSPPTALPAAPADRVRDFLQLCPGHEAAPGGAHPAPRHARPRLRLPGQDHAHLQARPASLLE